MNHEFSCAFEVMKKNGLVNWHTLLIGFKRGWCDKRSVILFAENIIRVLDGDIDEFLLNIAFGEDLSNESMMKNISDLVGPITERESSAALNGWRYAKIIELLCSDSSDEEKILKLQELVAEFDFPEDMGGCGIYSNDGIDPLLAAKGVANNIFRDLKLNF